MRGFRATWLAAALICFIQIAAKPAAAAGSDTALHFQVKKHDLKWTGPCSASFFAAKDSGEGAEPLFEHADISKPARIPAGKYEVMLICPSTEGEYRQTKSLRVQGKKAVFKANLRPAFFLARVMRDGKEVAASLEVRDAFGRIVQQGRDKMALPVPPERLRVTARVDSAAVDVSRPIGAAIEFQGVAGKKLTRTIDASDGTIFLQTSENGRPAQGAAALRVPGSPVRVMEFETGAPVPVPPGVYDVIGQLNDSHDFAEIIKRRIEIRPGKRVKLKMNHVTGKLQPTLTFGGETLSSDEAEIQLFVKGALQAFNTIEPDETAKLKPGKYRLVANLLDVKLDDGSAWKQESDVVIKADKTSRVRMDLLPPTLNVRTQMGGRATSLRVQIFRPGAEAPLVERITPTDGTIGFRLPRGTYRVVASLPNEGAGFEQEARIALKRGAEQSHTFNIKAGRATVQVLDDGFAISAKIGFYARGAAAPSRVAKGGEEVVLPPGTYAIVAERRGKKYEFPSIEIPAGASIEKSFQLADASSVQDAN